MTRTRRPARSWGEGQDAEDVLDQSVWLRHLAGPHSAAGQPARGGGDDLPPIAAQQIQVVLGHRVLIHLGVHGRSDQLGAGTGQHCGGEHIVGQPVGQLGAHIGGGGGDDHQVGAVGQGDVLHLMGEVAVKGVHHGPVPGELFKSEGVMNWVAFRVITTSTEAWSFTSAEASAAAL